MDDARRAWLLFGAMAEGLGVSRDRLLAGGASAGGHLAVSIWTFTSNSTLTVPVNSFVLFNPVLDVNSLGSTRRIGFGLSADAANRISPITFLRAGHRRRSSFTERLTERFQSGIRSGTAI